MSDNCEKSGEREFEDYFRKEEPADLIPRLENVLERLDGYDDQELEVAAEIVQYVAKQLEAMDEDTAEEIADDEVVMRSISGKGATKKELEEAYRENADFAKKVNDEWTGVEPPIEKAIEETSEKSTELEPVALYREEDLGGGHVLLKSKADAGHPDYARYEWEPLVRLSAVLNRLKQINSNAGEVARDFHRDEETAADISPADHVDRKIWSPLDRLIEELEEFTQRTVVRSER